MRPSSKFSFPVAVSNFRGFLAGKDENFPQVRPIPWIGICRNKTSARTVKGKKLAGFQDSYGFCKTKSWLPSPIIRFKRPVFPASVKYCNFTHFSNFPTKFCSPQKVKKIGTLYYTAAMLSGILSVILKIGHTS